jgi:chitinase
MQIQVVMFSEDGEQTITINFEGVSKKDIIEIVENIKDYGFDLDHASEDLTTGEEEEDEITIIRLKTEKDHEKLIEIMSEMFGR